MSDPTPSSKEPREASERLAKWLCDLNDLHLYQRNNRGHDIHPVWDHLTTEGRETWLSLACGAIEASRG